MIKLQHDGSYNYMNKIQIKREKKKRKYRKQGMS